MKQWILYWVLGILSVWAAENQREVIDCNIIFEQRKAEIIKEIERIDEQQQALQALQNATQNVLDQKEADLKKREIALNNIQKEIEEREAKITRLLKRNEEILKQIRGATQSKVGETYAGMKDSKSAAILETLPDAEAAGILFALDTKVMSKILSKMTPQKAATLTQLLQKGPPFEEEKESPQPKTINPQNKEDSEGNAI
ncbi:MotE family protein [uncultured Helicobacter sp.]|uniref:MotE family protein n=1 Tax=uncultured Helicobacter sp. TaxID=175537 RepID=UPI002617811F|nr:MotE family protein [uncultured Helicobacter sp.]